MPRYPEWQGDYPRSKVCAGCGRRLRPSVVHFSKNRSTAGGLQRYCKRCNRDQYIKRRDMAG
jgi:hypothetical protein